MSNSISQETDPCKMTVNEILKLDNWQDLLKIKFGPDIDLRMYTLQRNLILSGEFERSQRQRNKRNGASRPSSKPCKRVNYGERVLAVEATERAYRAMEEQVRRMNEEVSDS